MRRKSLDTSTETQFSTVNSGATGGASSTGSASSPGPSRAALALTYSRSHWKTSAPQRTDISATSSRRELLAAPRCARKYRISRSNSWRSQQKSRRWSLASSKTWMVMVPGGSFGRGSGGRRGRGRRLDAHDRPGLPSEAKLERAVGVGGGGTRVRSGGGSAARRRAGRRCDVRAARLGRRGAGARSGETLRGGRGGRGGTGRATSVRAMQERG